jgi:hypothetical protein
VAASELQFLDLLLLRATEGAHGKGGDSANG